MIEQISALLLAFIIAIPFFIKWKLSYWKRRDVPYFQPKLFEYKFHVIVKNAYDDLKSKKAKIGGTYFLVNPVWIPMDLDLTKRIMSKDFDYFSDRTSMAHPEVDPLTGNLPELSGNRWKLLRAKISPAFTSGKLKAMYHLMEEAGEDLVNTLKLTTKINPTCEIKEIMISFTIQIIASCAFGIQTDTFTNDSISQYRNIARRTLADFKRKMILNLIFPKAIMEKIKLTEKYLEQFYFDLVENCTKYRRENSLKRDDFLNALVDLKDELNNGLTSEEIAAQCYIFFIGGFETSSTALDLVFYELSINQDVQDKLRQEILDASGSCGKIDYDTLMNLEYLDCVVNEALRLHLPIKIAIRTCTKDYKVPDTEFVIKKNDKIFLSFEGVQTDPEYHPDPLTFNPDRFQSKMAPFTFLPFGEGPRMCIAWRFGLLEIKLGVAKILSNFKVRFNSKTKLPFDYDALGLDLKNGVWLDFEPIKTQQHTNHL